MGSDTNGDARYSSIVNGVRWIARSLRDAHSRVETAISPKCSGRVPKSCMWRCWYIAIHWLAIIPPYGTLNSMSAGIWMFTGIAPAPCVRGRVIERNATTVSHTPDAIASAPSTTAVIAAGPWPSASQYQRTLVIPSPVRT